mgnify:CR=1 FL=1
MNEHQNAGSVAESEDLAPIEVSELDLFQKREKTAATGGTEKTTS